jgi:hypothetical protein
MEPNETTLTQLSWSLKEAIGRAISAEGTEEDWQEYKKLAMSYERKFCSGFRNFPKNGLKQQGK